MPALLDSRPMRLRIVTPVFNDWESFSILLAELDRVAATLPASVSVYAVNDGSTTAFPAASQIELQHLESVEILHLATNVGHQRAIAIGLCATVDDGGVDAVVVMDADGEDAPEAIPELLRAAAGLDEFCIVARRGRRSENLLFKSCYRLYKLLFKLLTGVQIDFGNFCLLSYSCARRLTHIADLWNNLPAAVLRSRLPIRSVSVDRARRYAGQSKMNLTSLVVHGLSGISVYAETIFVRFLFLSLGLFVLSVLAITVLFVLRIFFPAYATPGWATTVSFGLLMILVQTFSFTLSSVLMLLHNRVQRLVHPLTDYRTLQTIESREVIFAADVSVQA